MAGCYRRFCCNFSTIVQPLSISLVPSLDIQYMYLFMSNRFLINAHVLTPPDFTQPFKLQLGVSSMALAPFPSRQTGLIIQCLTFHEQFNKCQCSYITIEKETIVLLFALQFLTSCCQCIITTRI